MENKVCPKCSAPLTDVIETSTGKQLRRCSKNIWNKETRTNDGCDYVEWITPEPVIIDEKCPKCGKPLVMQVTRFGKKMKKCSTSTWDPQTKTASGCDFIEWINGTKEPLNEDCPDCGSKLVLFTTAAGKKMKKCSTSGWDKVEKKATGCSYIQWLKAGEYAETAGEQPPPTKDSSS